MAQIRAIGLQPDVLTPDDFRIVASEKLGLVKFALDALRSGDKKRIAAIGDIEPISVDDYYAAYLAMLPPTENIPQKRNVDSLSEQAVLKLLDLGVEPATAKRLVGKIMAAHMELRKANDIVMLAYQSYVSSATQDANEDADGDDGDIRGATCYNDLKSAGAVKNAGW
jgi:hypothetical protein